eukprot:gene9519-10521_t
MLRVFSLLLTSFLFFFTLVPSYSSSSSPCVLVRDEETDELFLLDKKAEVVHAIANENIVSALDLRVAEAEVVDTTSYTVGDPVPALHYPPTTPDMAMANLMTHIHYCSSQTFWKGSQRLPWKNPSLIRWKDGRYLLAHENETTISFLWMQMNNRHEDFFSPANLKEKHSETLVVAHASKARTEEEPRLMAVRNGSEVILTYLSRRFGLSHSAYLSLRTDQSAQANVLSTKITFSREVALQEDSPQTKSWIPFDYQGQLHWVVSVNPWHTVKEEKVDGDSSGTGPLTAKLITVQKSKEILPLPWSLEYGQLIKGGTPAVKVRGVYLTFFHTVSLFQKRFGLQTSFMGAMAFCPTYPFQLFSISHEPIFQDYLYKGHWADVYNDFVVAPGSFVVDDQEKYVYLSFGHQNKVGYIAKLDVNDLFSSLETVSSCG